VYLLPASAGPASRLEDGETAAFGELNINKNPALLEESHSGPWIDLNRNARGGRGFLMTFRAREASVSMVLRLRANFLVLSLRSTY
jgi:hypothetical protein